MYTIFLAMIFWNGSEYHQPVATTGKSLEQCQAIASRLDVTTLGQFHQGRGGAKSYNLECRK